MPVEINLWYYHRWWNELWVSSHFSADSERSFSTKKKIFTKQNMTMNDETIIGLGATKAAVYEYGGVT